jgi:ABC-2 type transport system permease protein
MASNSEFQVISHRGWLGGFSNLLKKENHRWWGTRKWLVQSLVWLAILNGILAMMLWSKPNFPPEMDEATRQAVMEELPKEALLTYIVMLGMVGAIGATILGQDTILSEKNSGTAAWIMSKPASRGSFILTKVISNSVGILFTLVIVQGAASYLQIWLKTGNALPLPEFAGAMGMAFLGMFFYLTLTIMLASITNSRGVVLGIPLLVNLGYQFLMAIADWLGDIMPWNLTMDMGTRRALALVLLDGQPLPTITPLIATMLWSILFIAIALWGFSREEF